MDEKEKERIREQILDGTIYNKIKYVNWRTKVFRRDRYKCQLCKKAGGSIQAHHIEPKYKNPEKIYEPTNGITLCWGCHNKVHKKKLVKKYTAKFQKLAKNNKPKPKVIRKKNVKISRNKKRRKVRSSRR